MCLNVFECLLCLSRSAVLGCFVFNLSQSGVDLYKDRFFVVAVFGSVVT